jgi:hypothetical protein
MVGPSGIGIFTVPEVNVDVPGVEEVALNITAGSPRHMVTGLGVIIGAGGV